MNKLKKLVSPSTLAATIASGLLLGSVATALAESYSQLATTPFQPDCTYGGTDSSHMLCHKDTFNGTYYWCCLDYSHGYQCGALVGAYGWCDPYP